MRPQILALILAPLLIVGGCSGNNHKLSAQQRLQQDAAAAAAAASAAERKRAEAQAFERALEEIERSRLKGELREADAWRQRLKLFEQKGGIKSSYREFFMTMIEVGARFDNKLISKEKFEMENASAMVRLETRLKEEQLIEEARAAMLAQRTEQAALNAQIIRENKRQADRAAALEMLRVSSELLRPTIVTPVTPPSSTTGTRVYNIKGRQITCTSTEMFTDCH